MFRHTPLLSAVLFGTNVALVQSAGRAQSVEEVAKIATAISVKIEAGDRTHQGSGVILQKQGDLYTVLTAAHVVRGGKSFKLTTAVDEQEYQVIASSVKRASVDIDLAVVQFRSSRNYQVAKIGNSNLLKLGMELYVVGFPVPTPTITQSVFAFREGRVTANSNKVFKDGYSLVYSNSTLPGMSGGAVLNRSGELVAIHGKGDRSADNQKTDFNLGIPINRFGEVATGLDVRLGIEIAKVPANSAPKADDYYVSGNNKRDAGDFRGALADFNRAIAINPKYVGAYNNRGLLRSQQLGDPQGALADYNQALKIDPQDAIVYNNRGTLKTEKLNDSRGAMMDFNRSIAINPRLATAYNNRGFLKEKLKDFRGALADYNKAIEINPQSASSYHNRGHLKLFGLDDVQGALSDLNKAIALNPENSETYSYRGYLKMLKLQDPQGALMDFSRAIALDPKNADAYFFRGIVKSKYQNDSAEGLQDLRMALTGNSESPHPQRSGVGMNSEARERMPPLLDTRRSQ
jgi:tetratricopeptide (TPR) repeat protein